MLYKAHNNGYFTEFEASRLATIQRTDAAAVANHLSAVKNSAVSPLTAATNGPLSQFGIQSAWNNIGSPPATVYGGWPATMTAATHPMWLLPPTKPAAIHSPTPWIY